MKRAIIIVSLIGSALLILDTMNAADSLFLFLFAGIIPGTDLRVSPIDMMAATATAITMIILRIAVWPIIRPSLVLPPTKLAIRKTTSRRTA